MKAFVFVITAVTCIAEVRTMTLRQAIDFAMTQNPDIVLARLDQQKARAGVSLAKDPFAPKVFAGSGAAWVKGFPSSIEGSAPSLFQVRTQMALFNRPQNYLIAQASEDARGAGIAIAQRQQEIIYRVASIYLDAAQAARSLEATRRQSENLARVRELTEQRVNEGRELPLETKKANLAVLKANQRAEALASDLINAETDLAIVLGLPPEDRVNPVQEESTAFEVPESEDASIERALEMSHEIKVLQSNLQSKQLEIKSYQAARLPRVNLVAQYQLFAKYAYQDYFQRFQRHGTQLGASIEIPILLGRTPSAQQQQADAEIAKLRVQVARVRGRLSNDMRRAYQDLRRAESSRSVARVDLDVTREELNVGLAQFDEGRLPLARVEALRAAENEKWLAYYESQHSAELARLNVLRQTGTLEMALR